MKKLFLTAALALTTGVAAHAQFSKGTKYAALSVTGFNMSYSKSADFNLGLNAEGGYYIADGWMLRGNLGYNHLKNTDRFTLGAGARYSFLQNGIFIGAGLEYGFDNYSATSTQHVTTVTNIITNVPVLDANGLPTYDADGNLVTTPVPSTPITTDKDVVTTSQERIHNLRIPIEIGYTFYVNHFLAIEPAVYSKMSLNHFSTGTEFGLKVGVGFYFDRIHVGKRSSQHDSQRRVPSQWDF